MLTKRQNLIETISGGSPDRFVKQFEAFGLIRGNPTSIGRPEYGKGPAVNAWGVTQEWPVGTPGPFPIHDAEHVVVKDVEHWRDYVTAPDLELPESAWEPFIEQAEAIDRHEQFVMPSVVPGIFEDCHYLCEIQATLMALYEHPQAMHDLIAYITEWELELADCYIRYLKPDGVFHHDDWGTQISTFMSGEMFEEFFLEPYKQVYGYYRDHGATMVVHHSDSYAATFVPYMIEMGVKVWQGVLTTNDIPELIRRYGDFIAFMGGIDSGVVDREGWMPDAIEAEVRRACAECGMRSFIPCATMGGVGSVYPGVYECVSEKIDLVNSEMAQREKNLTGG